MRIAHVVRVLWMFVLTAACGAAPTVLDYTVLPEMDVPSVSYIALQTRSADGSPGDPVNLAFVGTRAELLSAFVKAGWAPATTTTATHVAREIADDLVRHSDSTAPMSHRFLFNRNQDYAFEQQVGGSPRKRHHVRLWLTTIQIAGRPLWVASATFDKGLLILKHTHAHEPNVNLEREYIATRLVDAGLALRIDRIPGAGAAGLPPIAYQSDGFVVMLALSSSEEKKAKN